MGPYSHYAIASKLLPLLQPEQPGEYLWGAIAPDIRYLAHLRRETTHLTPQELIKITERYPLLKSFLLGYRVHCMIDQVDLVRVVGGAFPLNLLSFLRQKGFSPAQYTMLVEMYFLQSSTAENSFSGEINEVLSELGITSEQAVEFSRAIREYLRLHALDGAILAFQKIGMVENNRVQKYLQAYHTLEKQRLLLDLLMLSVKTSSLEKKVIEYVLTGLAV